MSSGLNWFMWYAENRHPIFPTICCLNRIKIGDELSLIFIFSSNLFILYSHAAHSHDYSRFHFSIEFDWDEKENEHFFCHSLRQ